MRKRSISKNEEGWSEKVEKYQNDGLFKKEAQKKADNKLKETNFITFLDLNVYGNTILDMIGLKDGIIHDKVLKSLKFHKRGYGNLLAIRMTLRKHLLEEMMLETGDEETDDEDDHRENENDDVETGDESEDENQE